MRCNGGPGSGPILTSAGLWKGGRPTDHEEYDYQAISDCEHNFGNRHQIGASPTNAYRIFMFSITFAAAGFPSSARNGAHHCPGRLSGYRSTPSNANRTGSWAGT